MHCWVSMLELRAATCSARGGGILPTDAPAVALEQVNMCLAHYIHCTSGHSYGSTVRAAQQRLHARKWHEQGSPAHAQAPAAAGDSTVTALTNRPLPNSKSTAAQLHAQAATLPHAHRLDGCPSAAAAASPHASRHLFALCFAAATAATGGQGSARGHRQHGGDMQAARVHQRGVIIPCFDVTLKQAKGVRTSTFIALVVTLQGYGTGGTDRGGFQYSKGAEQ
jgi:hypothetical protein